MLPFIQSVGDHRTWMVEFTTRSVLGSSLVKVQRAVARRLVSTNARVTRRYNDLVEKQFEEHNIVRGLNACIAKVDACECPGTS